MAREPQDPLQALLQREKTIKGQILDRMVTEVDPLGFSVQQLGLEYAMIGKDGRIWVRCDEGLKVVFDPRSFQKVVEVPFD